MSILSRASLTWNLKLSWEYNNTLNKTETSLLKWQGRMKQKRMFKKEIWVTVLTQVPFSLVSSSFSQGLWDIVLLFTQLKVSLCRLWKTITHCNCCKGAVGSSRRETVPKNHSRERTLSPTSRPVSQFSIQLHHSYNHYTFSWTLKTKLRNLFKRKLFVTEIFHGDTQ